MRKLNVFIDGSCLDVTKKDKAVGGWGYIITDNKFNELHRDFGKLREGDQNSQRAELEALYRALLKMKTFKGNCKFDIYSDCETLVDGVNGFCKRMANRDIWNMIEPLCLELAGNFKIYYTPSHQERNGDKIIDYNFKVDRLAFAGANSLTKTPVAI
jgi:ribonuclease HI